MQRFVAAVLLSGLGLAGWGLTGWGPSGMVASAQTSPPDAISASLSPQDVARVFEGAVVEICAAAVSNGRRPAALDAAGHPRITANADPKTRAQSGAEPGDAVWDVVAARGVVTIHERLGRCVVSAYGPPAAETVQRVTIRLASAMGFEILPPAKTGFEQSLARTFDLRRVEVLIKASAPGMPGHQSRFSVLTATVSSPG